jgi:hypothetical protein
VAGNYWLSTQSITTFKCKLHILSGTLHLNRKYSPVFGTMKHLNVKCLRVCAFIHKGTDQMHIVSGTWQVIIGLNVSTTTKEHVQLLPNSSIKAMKPVHKWVFHKQYRRMSTEPTPDRAQGTHLSLILFSYCL